MKKTLYLVLLYLTIASCYHNDNCNKVVHLSFDDTIDCFKDLTNNSEKYESVFEQSFFKDLEYFHNKYGCKFSLYLFEQDSEFTISDVTDKYKDEFSDNSDWLKFGFHAIKQIEHASKENIDSICSSIVRTYNSIERISSSSNIAPCVRLHNFWGTQEIINTLKSRGVKSLLTADDNRISYILNKEQTSKMEINHSVIIDDIEYKPTDIRIEKYKKPQRKAFKILNKKDTIVIFTHEYIYNKQKLENIFQEFQENGVLIYE